MTRIYTWLLERALRPDVATHVVGDLLEQRDRGQLWLLRETLSALWNLHATPRPGDLIVTTFISDLRLAARLLRRSPLFAVISIVTLGLAIGATTAIMSIVRPVLMEPLPYPDPGRLAFVWERERDGGRENVGFATYRDLVAQSRTIESAAAIGSWMPTVFGDGDPERVAGDRVSWTYFRTLGVHPALGRDFRATEDVPGQNQVVILSNGLWRRRFGGDSAIVGRAISIDGAPMTVVGVMPASFDNVVTPGVEMWRALGYADQPWACRTCHHLRMLIRVRPGTDVAAATQELDQLHRRIAARFPSEYTSVGALTTMVRDEATKAFRPALLALVGAVLLVLLIAGANVINLQLARAVRREEEFSVRLALGAGQGRLIRQLLTEGLLLATVGGLAGLVVAAGAIPLLKSNLPPQMPRLGAIRLDGAAFTVVATLVLLLAVAMGLAPARSRAGDLSATLRSGRRTAGGIYRSMRAVLVSGEVALAVMLAISAGLVARSLVRLLAVDAGFDTTHLLTVEINSLGPRYRTGEPIFEVHEEVRVALAALPGVTSVALANQLPLGGNVDRNGIFDADSPPANTSLVPNADRYSVSPKYFTTMRIPLIRGRAFSEAEARDTSNYVVVVSDALARRMWPSQDPIGRRVVIGGTRPRTVIGVVGNVHHSGLDSDLNMQWYSPERQWGADNQETVIVRTAGDPVAVAALVRRTLSSIEGTQPIIKLSTMDAVIARSTSQRRLALVLFGAFAIAAVLLSISGIYGVLAGSVAERTREIGLRSALGATPREIAALILRQGGRLAGIGMGLGLVGAFLVSGALHTLLFGIGGHDPLTIGGVILLVSIVTLVACIVPAWRAARVDPGSALRAE